MRRRYSREQWLSWITEQRSSEMTVSVFCEAIGVGENSFYRWKAKFIAESEKAKQATRAQTTPAQMTSSQASPGFVPLSVVDSAQIEIDLPCGAVVRVPQDDDAVRCVLQVLMGSGSGQPGTGGATC